MEYVNSCKRCHKYSKCKPPFSVSACSQFEPDIKAKLDIARDFMHYVIDNLDSCDGCNQLCDSKISEVKWQAHEALKKMR